MIGTRLQWRRAVVALTFAAVVAGWFCHTPAPRTIGPYNGPYLIFLFVLCTPIGVPTMWRILVRRRGRKRAWFLVANLGLVAMMIFLLVSLIFNAVRRPPIDPYLQLAGVSFDQSRPAPSSKTLRVLTLGGSTTQGPRLVPEDRYPNRLQADLQRSFDELHVEVLNAGREWWTTKHSLIDYTTYLHLWKADIVVVMHAINDAARSFSPPRFAVGEYDMRWSHHYGPAISATRPVSLERWLTSRLARCWYSRLRYREADFPLSRYASVTMYEHHLGRLVDAIRQDGALAVIVTQPSLFGSPAEEPSQMWMGRSLFVEKVDSIRYRFASSASIGRAMKEFNGVARGVASTAGIGLVDAAAVVPPNPEHFVDGVHHTSRGSALLARLVGEGIAELMSSRLPVRE